MLILQFIFRLPKLVENEHEMADSLFVPIQEIQKDISKQFFIIKFKDIQLAGYQYKIHINYTGRLQDNMAGFYKSSYNIGNNKRLEILK